MQRVCHGRLVNSGRVIEKRRLPSFFLGGVGGGRIGVLGRQREM
jgi:hypothetical protein